MAALNLQTFRAVMVSAGPVVQLQAEELHVGGGLGDLAKHEARTLEALD